MFSGGIHSLIHSVSFSFAERVFKYCLQGLLGSRAHNWWVIGVFMVLAVVEALARQVLQHQDPIGDDARRIQHLTRRVIGKRKVEEVSGPVSMQEVIEEVSEQPGAWPAQLLSKPCFQT